MGTPYPEPVTPARTRIGWIGIGVMGSAMATHLLKAGYSLIVYARDPSKSAPLRSLGAGLASSPADLARSSDVVFAMVGKAHDVRQVVLGPDGVMAGLGPVCVAVDSTSSHPALAREVSAVARSKGCWAVDAPVSGGDVGAIEGKLAVFAAGERGVVEWLTPLFDLMGKATYMGEAGCGQSCKIANQIIVAANVVGLSEGLVFAEKAGLEVGDYIKTVKGGTGGSKVVKLWGRKMVEKDFKTGGFAEYILKDLGMGVDVVECESESGAVAVLPGAAISKQLFAAMVAKGNGKLGPQALVTVIQSINGM